MSRSKTGTLLLACAALTMWQLANSQSDDAALERATRILQSAPVVDGHNDLPWVIREKFGRDVEGYDISVRAQYDTDLPRLRHPVLVCLRTEFIVTAGGDDSTAGANRYRATHH
jgi:hypothetical protein